MKLAFSIAFVFFIGRNIGLRRQAQFIGEAHNQAGNTLHDIELGRNDAAV